MEPASTFGPRLRQERERRRISLESIAQNTKIGRSLLEALERDDVSRWPTGIFRRSFIRSYAKAIGLDPDETVREFVERFPDPAHPPDVPVEAPPSTPTLSHHTSHASPDRIEIVLRFSLPRWSVSWLSRLAWWTHSIPGRQNQNT